MSGFKNRRSPTDTIRVRVRWYCKCGVSYRDLRMPPTRVRKAGRRGFAELPLTEPCAPRRRIAAARAKREDFEIRLVAPAIPSFA